MGSSGEQTAISSEHRRILESEFGPISSYGVLNLEVDRDVQKRGGIPVIKAFIEVGAHTQGKILNEPGRMIIGKSDRSMMMNFMSGNFAEANRIADEIIREEPKFVGGSVSDPLIISERNTEHILFNDRESPLNKSLPYYGNKFTLVTPSKGTIVRLGMSTLHKQCAEVLLPDSMSDEDLDLYGTICFESHIKHRVIPSDYKCEDPELLYYTSFNNYSPKKYDLPNYIYCEPNPYQLVFNDKSVAINYNNSGYSVTYDRNGRMLRTTQLFENKEKCIIGADSLYEKFKKSKYVRGGMMHDIHMSNDLVTYEIDVVYGSTVVTNALCLVGNYRHKGNKIYSLADNSVVHVNDGRTMSSKTHGRFWVTATPKNIRSASYVIGIYSSVAVFLGDKIFLNSFPDGEYRIDGKCYRREDPNLNSELVIVHDLGGKISIREKFYTKVPLIPVTLELHMCFGNSNYCYGTYTTIIRDNAPSKDLIELNDVVVDATVSRVLDEFYDNVEVKYEKDVNFDSNDKIISKNDLDYHGIYNDAIGSNMYDEMIDTNKNKLMSYVKKNKNNLK